MTVVPVVLLAIAMFLSFAIHEGGHVIAAALLGQRLVLFVAGPLAVLRIDGRLRIGLNRRLQLYGGLALSVAPHWRGPARHIRSLLFVFLGGPALSFVAGSAMLVAARWLGHGHLVQMVHRPVAFGAFITGVMSVTIALVTVLPAFIRPNGPSDGARIRGAMHALRALRAGEFVAIHAPFDAFGAVSRLLHLYPPLQWDPGLVAALRVQIDDAPTVRGLLLLRLHALAVGQTTDAAAFLAQASALAVDGDPALRTLVALERAQHEALWCADATAAVTELREAGIDGDTTAMSAVVRAALAQLDGASVDFRALRATIDDAAWRDVSPGFANSQAVALAQLEANARALRSRAAGH